MNPTANLTSVTSTCAKLHCGPNKKQPLDNGLPASNHTDDLDSLHLLAPLLGQQYHTLDNSVLQVQDILNNIFQITKIRKAKIL